MNLDINHLLADKLENVLQKLADHKFEVDTLETSPSARRRGSGSRRVLSIKKTAADRIKIIWSYENYL